MPELPPDSPETLDAQAIDQILADLEGFGIADTDQLISITVKGKVVSSPRIITADQTRATIKQGTKIPYQQATSSGATSVSFVDAALMLQVTPQITPEGNVIMTVEVDNDSVGTVYAGVPSIDTKSIQTQVLVENGGTVVIGGIFQQSENTDISKVPFLGDVPYLGNLFKTTTKSTTRTEMLIFLTPKVVTDRTAAR